MLLEEDEEEGDIEGGCSMAKIEAGTTGMWMPTPCPPRVTWRHRCKGGFAMSTSVCGE